MRILAIGDVTSPLGLSHLAKNLWKYREENKIDFVIKKTITITKLFQ